MNTSNILKQIISCNTDEPYVFISYSSADRELVWQDTLVFQENGYNVWLDEKNIDKTKASWKEDALGAIEDYNCELLVFYISKSSLVSENCYNELKKTTDETTKAQHFGPVGFIAIDVENIDDIEIYTKTIYDSIKNDKSVDKSRKIKMFTTLNEFKKHFFDSNNERIRIHHKNEMNRKMDYYEEIMASFPEVARNAKIGSGKNENIQMLDQQENNHTSEKIREYDLVSEESFEKYILLYRASEYLDFCNIESIFKTYGYDLLEGKGLEYWVMVEPECYFIMRISGYNSARIRFISARGDKLTREMLEKLDKTIPEILEHFARHRMAENDIVISDTLSKKIKSKALENIEDWVGKLPVLESGRVVIEKIDANKFIVNIVKSSETIWSDDKKNSDFTLLEDCLYVYAKAEWFTFYNVLKNYGCNKKWARNKGACYFVEVDRDSYFRVWLNSETHAYVSFISLSGRELVVDYLEQFKKVIPKLMELWACYLMEKKNIKITEAFMKEIKNKIRNEFMCEREWPIEEDKNIMIEKVEYISQQGTNIRPKDKQDVFIMKLSR